MEQALQLIRDFAVVMGTETARLWPKIVLANWIEAVVFFVLVPSGFVWGLWALLRAGKHFKQVQITDCQESCARGLVCVIGGGLLVLMCGLGIFFGAHFQLATLLEPEGATAKSIIHSVNRNK